MKRILISFILMTIAAELNAQEKILLYPEHPDLKIGGSQKVEEAPQLLYFSSGTGTAKRCVLICPGGGYTVHAKDHEGFDVAKYFNSKGYDAFILLYRLNDAQQTGSRFPAQLDDVTKAMQIIKSRAGQYGIDKNKVGVLGFSAGGHLASMAATMFKSGDPTSKDPLKKESSRPAFAILIYPVISFRDNFAHTFSGEMLMGKNARQSQKDSLTTYNRVSAQTPPTFLVFSNDDKSVPPENGTYFYHALRKHGIPASIHIYPHGGHGYGLAPKDPVLNTWPELAMKWLEETVK